MYKIDAMIHGTAGLLQHAFGQAQLAGLQERSSKRTAKPDYSFEWMDTMYTSPSKNGKTLLVQPATHIEGAMIKAGTNFKMRGRITYKDSVKGFIFVSPDAIPHLRDGEIVEAPDESLLESPTESMSVSIMRVVIQRSAVARSRLLIAPGWELAFNIAVQDDDISADTVYKILEHAGHSIGIGDYRPRYGRFTISKFEVVE